MTPTEPLVKQEQIDALLLALQMLENRVSALEMASQSHADSVGQVRGFIQSLFPSRAIEAPAQD